jgi:hypothetical protein
MAAVKLPKAKLYSVGFAESVTVRVLLSSPMVAALYSQAVVESDSPVTQRSGSELQLEL